MNCLDVCSNCICNIDILYIYNHYSVCDMIVRYWEVWALRKLDWQPVNKGFALISQCCATNSPRLDFQKTTYGDTKGMLYGRSATRESIIHWRHDDMAQVNIICHTGSVSQQITQSILPWSSRGPREGSFMEGYIVSIWRCSSIEKAGIGKPLRPF